MLFSKVFKVINESISKILYATSNSSPLRTKLTLRDIPKSSSYIGDYFKTFLLKFNKTNVVFLGDKYKNKINWSQVKLYVSLNSILRYTNVELFSLLFFNIVASLRWLFIFIFSSRISIWVYLFALLMDATFADDEPIWEPTEWSFLQTWILFTFAFAWIMENLISSRYGSYVGRDKKVWLGWYKTYWMIQYFYALNYAAAAVFFTTTFYNELVYPVFYMYSWWHWFNRAFLFKYTFMSVIMLMLGLQLLLSAKTLNWRKALVLTGTVLLILSYLIFTHFVMVFFGYFTDAAWFHKYRGNVYSSLTHAPWKWGYGPKKNRENFYEHCSRTVFWFKNDDPFAGSLMMFHFFYFVVLFTVFVYWITLFQRIYYTKEVPITFTTYCVSTLKHFTNFFLLLYSAVLVSLLFNYIRLPYEYSPHSEPYPFTSNLIQVIQDYPLFIYEYYITTWF